MPLTFREIPFGSDDYKALLGLRYEVLRKPLGMQMREKDTKNDAHEHHLAVFDGETLLGCVLLRPLHTTAVQLRQMAILESHRGKGMGAQLAGFAERYAKQKGYASIETRARHNVQGFYEKLGYTAHENEFSDEHTLRMRKFLR